MVLSNTTDRGVITFAIVLLAVDPNLYDLVLWWALLSLQFQKQPAGWFTAVGVALSSSRAAVPATTVFGAICAGSITAKLANGRPAVEALNAI